MNYTEAVKLLETTTTITRWKWPNDVFVTRLSPAESGIEEISVRGIKAPLASFLVIRDEEGIFKPYCPSQEDLEAEDWLELED